MINLHPIFIHFPVALLSLYAIAELVPFKKIKNQPYWFYFKAIVLICGTAGSYMAILTGDGAKEVVLSGQDGLKHLIDNPRAVINMHETFADATVLIFSALSAAYVVAWLNIINFSRFLKGTALQGLWKFAMACKGIIIETKLVYILALAGLASLTITAALGGAIVYGPNADPFVNIIYNHIIR